MKAIVCELCDGREFAKVDGMFVCQSCGAKYTPEDAKSLMKEVEGEAAPAVSSAPKSAPTADLDRYLTLARRAKESDNNADAAKYYGLAQAEDPNSWECLFFSTYFTAMQTNIAGIASAANLVKNCLASVLDLVVNNTPAEEQHDAVTTIVSHCVVISQMLFGAARNHYNGIGDSIRSNYTGEYRQRALCCVAITDTLGDLLAAHFGDDSAYNILVAESFKNGFTLKENNSFAFNNATVTIADLEKLAKFDQSYVNAKANTMINQINNSVKILSNAKQSNGCLAFLCAIAAIVFVCLGIIYYESYFYGFTAIFGVLTVVCAIPKPKSASKKEKDDKEIARLTANKQRLENIIK